MVKYHHHHRHLTTIKPTKLPQWMSVHDLRHEMQGLVWPQTLTDIDPYLR
jgi:hypothetical protein